MKYRKKSSQTSLRSMSNIRPMVNVQPLFNISHLLVYVGEDPREEWNNEQIRYDISKKAKNMYISKTLFYLNAPFASFTSLKELKAASQGLWNTYFICPCIRRFSLYKGSH
jgi:hypothetical protein